MNINQYLQDFAGTWPCVGLILIREDMAKCTLDNLNGGTSKKGGAMPPTLGVGVGNLLHSRRSEFAT